MPDDSSLLTRDVVQQEAGEIILAIAASRQQRGAFEENWSKLWQLLREAKTALVPSESPTAGPWHLSSTRDGRYGPSPSLTAGSFAVPLWPPDAMRTGADLPELLNWAGVPVPDESEEARQ